MSLTPDHRVNSFIQRILQLEKGYVDNPDDSGGETNWGITEAVARENGFIAPMWSMTQTQARDIYAQVYWYKPKLELLLEVSSDVAWEVFDAGVNCGTGTAIKFLQQTLNVFNLKGKLYEDLKVDGVLGGQTALALKFYFTHRKSFAEPVLLKALNCLQGSYYIRLAEAREKDETFVFGWINKRVELPN